MKFRIEHTFAIDRERYENDVFFHTGLEARIDAGLQMGTKERREEKDDDTLLYRENLVSPQRDLPSPIKKIVKGRGIGYFERTTYYKGKHYLEWSIASEIMPTKITGGGKILFEEAGDQTKRIVTGEMNVKIFGVGGIIERLVVDNIKQSYETVAQLTQEWIREHHS